jgi:pyruvate-formate lyase-activating enzyme
MRYLLETRPDVVFNMINHLDRKSISDCLFKVMISYVPDYNDQEVKKEALMRIFKSFKSGEPEVYLSNFRDHHVFQTC